MKGLTCFILGVSVAALAAPAPKVTFTKDVAPIFYSRCVECHRPGEIAPMSLLTYESARPWAKSIREKVSARVMPPWHADPKYGKFENDPSLSAKEIETIVAWADSGAPKGNDKDMPAAPKFTDGWTIGQPDVVFEMPEAHAVPAEGVVPYLYFTMPTNFTEDKWIQALEIRPGNRAVVHHVIAFATAPGTNGRGQGGEGGSGRGQLGGITPNKTGVVFSPGTGRLIKAGSNIVFQMHYTPNGTAVKDRTRIGLVFSKEPPKQILVTGNAMNFAFRIPAGDPNYEVVASKTFNEDTTITSFMPHMHFRGKDFTYTATYPDGRSEILLSVPKYDFNWQLTYKLKEPLTLPKGTKLTCVAHFDNSPGNKYNPDPSKEVKWGDQTWEEMMIGWFSTVKDAPAKTMSASRD